MATNDNKLDDKQTAKLCAHMNADHKDALSYYLKYYSNIAYPKDCKLSKIDVMGMEIQYELGSAAKEETTRIPFQTPVLNIAEARETLNYMLQAAYKGLGLSPRQVTKYQLSLAQVSMFGLSTYFLATMTTPISVTPLEPFIRGLIPAKYRLLAALSIPLINLTEFSIFTLPLLIQHRVPTKQRLEWFVANLTCGFPSIWTLQELARR